MRDSKPAALNQHITDILHQRAAESTVLGVFDSKPAARNAKRLPTGKRNIGKLPDKPTPMRKKPGSPRKRNRLSLPDTLALQMQDTTAVHHQPDNRRRTRQSPSPSPGGMQHPKTCSRSSPMESNAWHVAEYDFETVNQNEANDANDAVANADDEYGDDL